MDVLMLLWHLAMVEGTDIKVVHVSGTSWCVTFGIHAFFFFQLKKRISLVTILIGFLLLDFIFLKNSGFGLFQPKPTDQSFMLSLSFAFVDFIKQTEPFVSLLEDFLHLRHQFVFLCENY